MSISNIFKKAKENDFNEFEKSCLDLFEVEDPVERKQLCEIIDLYLDALLHEKQINADKLSFILWHAHLNGIESNQAQHFLEMIECYNPNSILIVACHVQEWGEKFHKF